MAVRLPRTEARKIALHSQRLYVQPGFGEGAAATLDAITHLGYVQIDTLSVVPRAHLHTLWNRVRNFNRSHIDQLQRDREIYEHWAHALAYLPMKEYRFSLPMMHRIASGDTHWYPKNAKQTAMALKRIREEGPLLAKDFNDKKTSTAMWARSPSKRALEQLFMEGELMVPHRLNFHKVYDLRERVLPDHIDTRIPDIKEQTRHLICTFLRAHGLGQTVEIAYLRKGMAPVIREVVSEMLEDNLLLAVQFDGREYYCLPGSLKFIDKNLPARKIKILSPFDNSIIQRKRVKELFGFDYQLECYVPKAKRKFGYFCLPVLWNNKLVARMDAKADRKEGVFHVQHLHLEESLKRTDSFMSSLHRELEKFAKFDNCERVLIHKISGASA
jgi:uncharacterized protein YcaQ